MFFISAPTRSLHSWSPFSLRLQLCFTYLSISVLRQKVSPRHFCTGHSRQHLIVPTVINQPLPGAHLCGSSSYGRTYYAMYPPLPFELTLACACRLSAFKGTFFGLRAKMEPGSHDRYSHQRECPLFLCTVRTKPGYFHFMCGDNPFSPTYLGFWERVRKRVISDHPESG